MKFGAIFLIIVVVLAVGMTAYVFMNTDLTCTATGVRVESFSTQPNSFYVLQSALDTNAVQGTVYQTSMAGTSDEYDIMTFTINIENRCLLEAEMVEIQIRPADGDIVCFSGSDSIGRSIPATIKALSTGDVSCVLITKVGNHAVREFIVTYYIWGRPYNTRCTFG